MCSFYLLVLLFFFFILKFWYRFVAEKLQRVSELNLEIALLGRKYVYSLGNPISLSPSIPPIPFSYHHLVLASVMLMKKVKKKYNNNIYSGLNGTDEALCCSYDMGKHLRGLKIQFWGPWLVIAPSEVLGICILTFLYYFSLLRFNENIMMDPGMVDIYPYTRIKKDMQHHFRPVYRFTNGSNGRKEKGLRITTESSSVSLVLKWIPDNEVSI